MVIDKFNKPFEVNQSSAFITEVHNYLNEYKVTLSTLLQECVDSGKISITKKASYYTRTANLADLLVSVLEEHTQNEVKAIDLFDIAMKSLKSVFESQTFYNEFAKQNHFYRIRTDKVTNKDKYAIFHIPFNLREKIANLRFNAPGFPCLYCANTLETAWIESRRPGANSLIAENKFLNAAVFSTSENVPFLDISFKDMQQLKAKSTGTKADLVEYINYLQLFPLIAALHCKIIDNSVDGVNFHYEYLLPTMFMRWFINDKQTKAILPNNLNTIKYSSVENFNPSYDFNIVAPAKFSLGANYCSFLERVFLNKFYNYYHNEISIDQIDVNFIIELQKKLLSLI